MMGIIQTDQLVFDNVTGDISRGGWEASASLINAQGYADYSRRAELYYMPEGGGVWSEDWLLGLRGFILPKQVTFDKGQSRTEVTLATSHVFLENAGLQGLYFNTGAADPNNPHQMPTWTLGGIVKHIVEEHTNITDWVDTSGIETTDSTSINYYTIHESDSMWNVIQNIGANEFYVPYFTKDDRLIYDVHPMFAPSLPEPVMEIDSNYIVGQPTVRYRDELLPDQVRLWALTDDGDVLYKEYPDNIGVDGRRHPFQNLRCNDEPRLTQLAQRAFLFLQRRYVVDLTIAGPWGLLMELYDRVELTYSGTSRNGVGFVWDQKKFWIQKITVRRVHNFGAVTDLTLDEENYTEGYIYSYPS